MGFGATKPPVVVDSYCENYKPVRWSKNDTPETAQQVRENNAVYKALCPRNK